MLEHFSIKILQACSVCFNIEPFLFVSFNNQNFVWKTIFYNQ